MVADMFDLALSMPDTHHAGGQSGYIGPGFAVLLAAHLAPEGLEDRIGRNRNPSSDRALVRHEDQLHQQIVVILIQLLTGETNLHTVYGRHQRIPDETAILPLDARKERTPSHVVRDRSRGFGEERELDDLG